MTCKSFKYIIFSLFAVAYMTTSCHDEKLPIGNEQPSEETSDGDMLVVNITLDNMGGKATRANDPLEKWENYVDPEKIRVLVFDEDDKFLFESKSRFIRQLDDADDHLVWSVSIPLYTYGNDREYEWEWSKIRDKLTTGDFKIAILANRPDKEWNFGILRRANATEDEAQLPENYIVFNGWFDNSGPDWKKKNSSVYDGNDGEKKDVFDLHFCQYDPIYHGKNYYTTSGSQYEKRNFNFYSCITGGNDEERPYMGAVSSWVNWGTNDESGAWDEKKNQYGSGKGVNRDPYGWDFRKTILPSESHPIPMYGIQKFSRLEGWKKGTTMNLDRSTDKAISLLRSVVKLELLVPQNYVKDVLLFYSNLYARCEPMDVWTPTDQIWHREDNIHPSTNAICKDIELIQKFGRMSIREGNVMDPQGDNLSTITESKEIYQQRLSWVYGLWKKSGKLKSFNKDETYHNDIDGFFDETYENKTEDDFVRIFNPCVQRNTAVYVDKSYTDDYDHYVVYTGERSINDPSNLGQIGNGGGGGPTVIFWCIVNNAGNTYSMPIVDYNKADIAEVIGKSTLGGAKPAVGNAGMSNYAPKVQNGTLEKKNWPLPLLRNHVYRITLTGSNAKTRSNGEMDFSIQFEEKHTKDIGFPIKKE